MIKKLLLVGMIALLFMGCGGSKEAESDVVEITYLSTTIIEVPEGSYEQAIIDEFNALDNGIHVTVESVNNNELMKKIITLATADDMPDFFMYNDQDMASLIEMELVAPLNPIMGQEYVDGFTDVSVASVKRDGILYGAPWFTGAQAVLYRKDVFDEKGLKPATTWDEFVDLSVALTDGTTYGNVIIGARNGSGAFRFQTVMRNFGVDEFMQDSSGKWITDVGSEKYIKALKDYTDLATVYDTVPPGVTETDYPTGVGLFSSGKGNMLVTGSNAIGAITAQVPELKGKLGSFTLPVVERSVCTAGGMGFAISPGKNEAAAAEFIEYMLSKKNQTDFSILTGRLPTRTEVAEDEAVMSMPELSGFLAALENVYVIPAIPGYSEMYDIHGEAYQSVFLGTATVEEAAAKAKERSQELCDKANDA